MGDEQTVFLSHAGIDKEPARRLKKRLEEGAAARDKRLRVWLDVDSLHQGPWQRQLEDAIETASAFAVYVGSAGVVNWVEAEVSLALARAYKANSQFPFIPILADASSGSQSLPGFARLFQSVRNVESDPDEFRKLLDWILGESDAGGRAIETQPFCGLKAIDEQHSHLFFGRESETKALLGMLKRSSLVLLTGDSGSGKSSLVKAGLSVAWRGGAAVEYGAQSADLVWHIVEVRPRGNPRRALGGAVFDAARALGVGVKDSGAFSDWATAGTSEQVRLALRCGLPSEQTRTLLVVDQFEELWTQATPDRRQSFVELLLQLTTANDDQIKCVLTMRRDYYNLCTEFPELSRLLERDTPRSKLLLGRMSDEGLEKAIRGPLSLAGVQEKDRTALASLVLQDVGDRPGDLALLEFALTEAWNSRAEHGNSLIGSYVAVGRVDGALARAAERVFQDRLSRFSEQDVEATFMRLVRLGDTAGATRRPAKRSEFSEERWNIVQLLSRDEGNRLVLVTGPETDERAEISHEALVSQWPRFQRWLQECADDKRVLDPLISRASLWSRESDAAKQLELLASGVDRLNFQTLLERRAYWLTETEANYVQASTDAYRREIEERELSRQREIEAAHSLANARLQLARNSRTALLISIAIGTVAVGAAIFGFFQQGRAADQAAEATRQERIAVSLAAENEAVAAPSLASAGYVDQAILQLLDAAELLPSDPPDKIKIAYNNVVRHVAKPLAAYDVPKDMDAIDSKSGLFLTDPATNHIWTIGTDGKPLDMGLGIDGSAADFASLTDETHAIVVRTSGAVERLDLKADTYTQLVKLPAIARPAGTSGSRRTFYMHSDGTLVYDIEFFGDEADVFSAFIIDTLGGTFAELKDLESDVRYGRLASGKRVANVIDRYYELTSAESSVTLKPITLSEKQANELVVDHCLDGTGADRSIYGPAILKNFQAGNLRLQDSTTCWNAGDSLVVRYYTSNSGGGAEGYEQEEGSDYAEDLQQTLGIDDSDNVTWIDIDSSGSVAELIGSDAVVRVGDNGEAVRVSHNGTPSAIKLLEGNRVAVVEAREGRVVVDDLDPDSLQAASFEAMPAVQDGQNLMEVIQPVHYGNCIGFSERPDRPVQTGGGLTLSMTESDQGTVLDVEGSKSAKLLIGTNVECFEVSADGTRLMVSEGSGSGTKLSLYDFQRLITSNDLAQSLMAARTVSADTVPFLTGDATAVVAGVGTQVYKYGLVDQTREVLFRGTLRVVYAEPSPNGDSILVVSTQGSSEYLAQVYSIPARETLIDLGQAYKWLGVAFVAADKVAYDANTSYRAIFRVPTFAELIDKVRDRLVNDCKPEQTGAFRSSICWGPSLP